MDLRSKIERQVMRRYEKIKKELARLLIKNHGAIRFKVDESYINNLKDLCKEHPHWPINVIIAESITEVKDASPNFLGASLLVESEKWFKYQSMGFILNKFMTENNLKLNIMTEDIKTESHTFKLIIQINLVENEEDGIASKENIQLNETIRKE